MKTVGVSLCLLLASCRAPAPASVPTPARLPISFTASGQRELPERWWTDFGDPALDRLVEAALLGNFDLRTFWDRLAQFEAIAAGEGAARRLTVDATAGAEGSVTRREHENLDTTDFRLGIAARYELDFWGRLRAREEAAGFDVRASEEEVRTAAISLSALVATTWYQLVERREQIALLEEQNRTNAQILELIELRFQQGQFAAADVLRQRQLIEATRGDGVLAEADAELLENLLAVLLGRAPGRPLRIGEARRLELPSLPDTGVPARLVERRPDVRSAFYRVLASDRDVAAAIADRYPRFSLSGLLRTNSGGAGELFRTWFASLLLEGVQPILDGGARGAELDRTRAVVSERLSDYGATILTALREVEDALVGERRQREFLRSLDRQIELSEEVLDRIRDRYLNGAVGYLDTLQAIISLQNLQRSRVLANHRLIEFRINLCRALAGGWKMDRPEPATIRAPSAAGERDARTTDE